MRLLFISGANITASGGDAVHTLEMAGGLAGSGARVTLVLKGNYLGQGRPGIRVVGMPVTGNRYLDAMIWPVMVSLVAVFLTLLRDFDAVYVRDSIYEVPVVLLLRLLRKRVLLEVNAVTAEDLGSRRRASWKVALARRLQRRACLAATRVLPVTTALARWLVEQGVPSGRVTLVPNGANPYLYRTLAKKDCLAGLGLNPLKKYFCFAGNLAPWQGGDMILEAFGRLARDHPEASLLVIGDGQERGELEHQTRRLGIQDRVIFTGRLPYSRVPVAMNACVAGIGGGWYGGNKLIKKRYRYSGSSALKVFSYLACGLPVVVPEIPDLAGIIRRERCGLVVKPDREEKLVEALRAVLANPRHWAEAGLKGRTYIEREASWECRAARVLSLVERTKGSWTGGCMKRLLYLTVTAPLGQPEAFLIPEMNCLIRQGIDLTIVPIRPSGAVFHLDGANLLRRCIIAGLWSKEVWLSALAWLLKSPLKVFGLLFLLLKSGRPVNRVKNLLIFPKCLFIAAKVESLGISHIHAHWASTPSTCALVASALTGVAWSFTAHRWDITNDNMVAEKVRRSSFVRVISSRGGKQIVEIAGPEVKKKVVYCPMGVEIPGSLAGENNVVGERPVIVSVGNLTALKGHRYLLQACRMLSDKGIHFKCLIIGDGPERDNLSRLADGLGMKKYAIFSGALSHDRVIWLFRTGTIRLLVHPSIETPAGESEGVPVAIMEAMAHGVPVIVTDTGSVVDLVGAECGLKVPPGQPEALARAIGDLLKDPARAQTMAKAAYQQVGEKFNLCKNVSLLLSGMGISAEGVCHGEGKSGGSSHGDHRPDRS